MNTSAFLRASWEALLDLEDDGAIVGRVQRELSPIRGLSHRWELLLCQRSLEPFRWDERECVERGLSSARALKLTIQGVVYDDNVEAPGLEDVREQEVYAGELIAPYRGNVVIVDGAPRIVRPELAPCPGLAPFERGWRIANHWGDWLAFEPVADGVELVLHLAEDAVASAWTHEPPALEARPRAKVPFIEPKLPTRWTLRTREDAAKFYQQIRLPDESWHWGVPRVLTDRTFDEGWSLEGLLALIDWVRSDEGDRARREAPAPLRVMGPGWVVGRWLRRGLFLTAQHARARAETLTFGTALKPKKKPDLFSWLPHDVWSASPLFSLLRDRLTSDEHSAHVAPSMVYESAALQRRAVVPASLDVPDSWGVARRKRERTLVDLPLCAISELGMIANPAQFSADSLGRALTFGATRDPPRALPIASPEPSPIESALDDEALALSGAVRVFDAETDVLARTEDAVALRVGDGARWERTDAPRAHGEALAIERIETSAGSHRAGDRWTGALCTVGGRLALGRVLRVAADRRVSAGAIWVSVARIGDALDAMRAREVESVVRDTRYGREEWLGGDELPGEGAVIRAGETLVTVLEPIADTRSREELIEAERAGGPMLLTRARPVQWSGPDATIVARSVRARRGIVEADRLRAQRAEQARANAACVAATEALDERWRDSLQQQLADQLERGQRGMDLPPGVIASVRWVLHWRDPLAAGRALQTRAGAPLRVERVQREPMFDGAATVDAYLHPETLAQIDLEARATAARALREERSTVEPDADAAAQLEKWGADASADAPRSLYVLRVD